MRANLSTTGDGVDVVEAQYDNTSHRPNAVTIVANEVGSGGGMERQLMNLVNGLVRRGYPTTVISRECSSRTHPLVTFVKVRGPRRPFVVAYPVFALVASWKLLRHRKGLVHVTGAIVFPKADVVTVHLCHHAVARIAGLVRTRSASRIGRTHARIAAAFSRRGERWAYRSGRLRRMVSVSDGGRRELVAAFPELAEIVVTIPNGVDVPAVGQRDVEGWRPPPHLSGGAPVAAFVGSEWEGKGLRHAIAALAHAPTWHLVVVGRGDQPRYERIAEKLDVGDRVHFCGWQDEMAPIYARADVFVLPSSYETFSLVTFEAAAAGLPLLVTRVSGVEEILEDDVTGWGITQDGHDIANRLRLLSNDRVRLRLGAAARTAAARYSWDRMVEQYIALYRELANEPR
ncbi:MAG: hypothetical protein QOI98_2588 [Solirubrobacteraceae bacterium]|nr:hypothetical protein [Solirubrobacteraceae bacterium]